MSLSRRKITTTAPRPNAQRQLAYVASKPPIVGPAATPIAVIAPKIANPNALSFPVYVDISNEAIIGNIIAPPKPSITDHPQKKIPTFGLRAVVTAPTQYII